MMHLRSSHPRHLQGGNVTIPTSGPSLQIFLGVLTAGCFIAGSAAASKVESTDDCKAKGDLQVSSTALIMLGVWFLAILTLANFSKKVQE